MSKKKQVAKTETQMPTEKERLLLALTANESDIVFDCGLRTTSGPVICYDDLHPGAVLDLVVPAPSELSIIESPSGGSPIEHMATITQGILLAGPRASLPEKWYRSNSRVSQGDVSPKDVQKFLDAEVTVLPLVSRPHFEPALTIPGVVWCKYWGLPITVKVAQITAVRGALTGNLTKGRSKGVPLQMGVRACLADI